MILDRDFAKVGADELVSIGSPLLIELLNHASNAFIRVQGNASDEADIDIAPLCMYRHVMEMIDAVQVCVSQACAVGAIPALRTVFEASLSLEFVVQRDYSARARAWLFYTMRKKIDGMIRFDRQSPTGRALVEAYQREFQKDPGGALTPELQQELDGNILWLETAPFDEPRRQFNQLSSQGTQPQRLKWWFQLTTPAFRSLRSLAQELGHQTEYDILYTQWSEIAHASGFASVFRGGSFPAVRSPHELQQVIRIAAIIQLRATRLLINHFRPGESLNTWYVREIRPLFMRVSEMNIEFVDREVAPVR